MSDWLSLLSFVCELFSQAYSSEFLSLFVNQNCSVRGYQAVIGV